jgi:hypothetical protein
MVINFLAYMVCATELAVHAEPVDFEAQIAPIFAEHCLSCHSPNIKKGELSLADGAELLESGYLIPGDAAASYLMEMVTALPGQKPKMPMDGASLSEQQVELLRAWIDAGAAWPAGHVIHEKSKADLSWWSLQPLSQQFKGSIDEFIGQKLAEKGLTTNPPADRRVLIRRATYDLTGLPPTPAECAEFENSNDPLAYEKLIDRLLSSHAYGERWGRHWLDVVRFGESIGYERNVINDNLWPFRDYVIRSINADKPFNQFIREHIAGDVFGSDDPQVAVGSAFLVAGPYDDVGNQDAVQAAQIRANTLDEIIGATGEAFLGMTLGCARCHDHKFDPITQRDYYGLYATFAGVRHGSVELATPQEREARGRRLQPLNARLAEKRKDLSQLNAAILQRAKQRLGDYQQAWTRPAIDRSGTEETFPAVEAKFVRFTCDAQDTNLDLNSGFGIDEFEVWSADHPQRNVAMASNGAKATGLSRQIEDFPEAYGPQHAIDGKTGARFIARGTNLTIELAAPTTIDRVIFSSARGETNPDHRKFTFVAEYHIEVSLDGKSWQEVCNGLDRAPINDGKALEHRLMQLEANAQDRRQRDAITRSIDELNREIASVPPLNSVWLGRRVEADAQGPFYVFVGGSPEKHGEAVVPTSLTALDHREARHARGTEPGLYYELAADTPEAERRLAFANWLVHPANPLTPRVLANRLWHYHFGTGIVDTPSDFGYMGGRPSHPELLDWLATQLIDNGWKIKHLHRLIMTSQTYRQASTYRPDAAQVDGDARLLWRFPPRRLSAEEVRDTFLHISGRMDFTPGGPGFRLYHFMQDNVCTYVPLDQHGPETYRRAVYHQNARASVVDLMTEFDQPDCTFSAPRRAATTTPLQALTLLNHQFTLDIATALSERLQRKDLRSAESQVRRTFELCFARLPNDEELEESIEFIQSHSLVAFCRVLLNSSELIYIQ